MPSDIYHQGLDSSFERVITIRSNSIDAVSGAEKKISQKLRYYFDSDVSQGVSKFLN